MTSSWFFLSTLNYDARSTTHQTQLQLIIIIIITIIIINATLCRWSYNCRYTNFHSFPRAPLLHWQQMCIPNVNIRHGNQDALLQSVHITVFNVTLNFTDRSLLHNEQSGNTVTCKFCTVTATGSKVTTCVTPGVTLRTPTLILTNSNFCPQSVFRCFVRILW